MTRRLSTVRDLAAEGGLDLELSLITLFEAGVDISDGRSSLSPTKLLIARSVLGLPVTNDRYAVETLARRAGLMEEEARIRLVKSRVLAKRRLKRIPSQLLKTAEEVLGIRRPTVLIAPL